MIYFNRYNTSWITGLGILFFLSYGAVNHLSAYMDTFNPVGSFVFGWERYIPFIPLFIVPYMSIDLLYGLAFFIIPKNRFKLDKYRKIINGLGFQLLFNQVFTLICFLSFPLKFSYQKPEIPSLYKPVFDTLLSFDLPYNQSPSLHISLMVILMVFYSQHIKSKWIKYSLNTWFILIGLSVMFVYQHHIIDLAMGLFAGIASVSLFNHPVDENENFHLNVHAFKGRLFMMFSSALAVSVIFLFILPILGNFKIINYHLNAWVYICGWFIFVSFLSMYKIKFWGHAFKIRKKDNTFTKSFYLLAYPYLKIRHAFIKPFNYYPYNLEVFPGIFIGNAISMKKEKKAGQFFNLAWEIDNQQSTTYSYPMLDLTAPRKEQIEEIIKHIRQERLKNHNIYIHCALGIFRTIYVTGSYLVVYEGKKPEEVIDYFLALGLHPKMKRYLARKKDKFTQLYRDIAPQ